MAKTIKTEPKPVKTNKTNNIKWHKLIRKFIARPVAYITVFTLAAYGMRQALHTLNDNAASVITVLAILALCWIIVDEN